MYVCRILKKYFKKKYRRYIYDGGGNIMLYFVKNIVFCLNKDWIVR